MRLIVKNAANQTLELTNSSNYALTDATGLAPAVSAVNMTKIATMDGSVLNSMSIESRNIVLTVYPLGAVEYNRIQLYKWFTPKSKIQLRYINEQRDMVIDGYVESFEGTFFEQAEVFSISILCPSPYFEDYTPKTITGYDVDPIALTNSGDTECGVLLHMTTSGAVYDMEISIGSQTFAIDHEFTNGDVLTLCTVRGRKSIEINGVNAINTVTDSSEWVQIPVGSSALSVAFSGSGIVEISGSYTELYAGG
jgi:hypothetical protein